MQQADKSIDTFHSTLRNMVKKCNYGSGSIEDTLNQDWFIIGLLDRRLSEQLCYTPNLSLVTKHSCMSGCMKMLNEKSGNEQII